MSRGIVSYEDVRKSIVEVSKLMYQKDMVNALAGNLSILKDGKVYITPSGVSKAFLKEEMLSVTDIDGNVLEKSSFKASSEIKLHLAIYKNRNVGAVIHAHSPYSTAFAMANIPIESKAFPELIVFFDKVPLAKYGTPSTDEIYEGVLEYINDYDVILLANHGIVACGSDIYDAFFKLEAIETVAKTIILSKLLGGERELSEEKLAELYRMKKKAKKANY